MNDPIDFFAALNEQCMKLPDYSNRDYVREELTLSTCKCYRQVFEKMRTKCNVQAHTSVLDYLQHGVIANSQAADVLALCMVYNCCKLHIAAIMYEIPRKQRASLHNYGIPQ